MDSRSYTASSFYQLLKQQDRAAFSDFYDHYAPALYGEILRKCEDEELAEEILVRVFLQAYRDLPLTNFDNRGLFTWMHVIMRGHVAHATGGFR